MRSFSVSLKLKNRDEELKRIRSSGLKWNCDRTEHKLKDFESSLSKLPVKPGLFKRFDGKVP